MRTVVGYKQMEILQTWSIHFKYFSLTPYPTHNRNVFQYSTQIQNHVHTQLHIRLANTSR